MLNLVAFQGRVAQNLVLASSPGGIQYCHMRVAVDRDYLSNGQRKTDFLSCVAWRDTAVFAAKYFAKGDVVTVRGRLEEDVWTDKESNKHSRMVVNVDSLYFGETKYAREERQRRTASNTELPPIPFDENIPPELINDVNPSF